MWLDPLRSFLSFPRLPALSLLAVAACAAPDRSISPFATGGSGQGATTGSPGEETSGGGEPDPTGLTTTSSTSSGGATSDSDSDGGLKFDVLGGDAGNAGDGGSKAGCDKVDFLFVIDNSGSMDGEQQNLIASFPGFVSTIQDTLMAQDYHIMVVDSDESAGATNQVSCQPDCCPSYCQQNPTAICNGKSCAGPQAACDGTLGAGKTKSKQGSECGIAGDRRWMTDGQPLLPETFACAALVGTDGSGLERPMEAMLEAISPPLNADGECNEGFLRDDAVLVVTFVTDEEDAMKSPGNAATWRQELVARKGGNEEAVVMLGLLGDLGVPNPVCQPPDQNGNGADDAPILRSFVESFPNGQWGSVCAPDYAPFFADAVSVIDTACDDFVPEG